MERFEIKKETECEKYLRSGAQTGITPEMKNLVANIEGTATEKIEQIIQIINQLERKKFDEKVFRKRTADQILQDGYVTGCTDVGLVYLALARAKGIPSKYIETIDLAWLEGNDSNYNGHIYAQSYCEDEKNWIWVDPEFERKIVPMPTDMAVFKEGFDSWDIGIKDFDSLKAAFDRFKIEWQVKNDR